MPRFIAPLLTALVVAGATTAVAAADRAASAFDPGGRGDTYTIGLWGDMPYSDLQKNTGVPNLIADMNESDLAFSVHDGDLKSGGDLCTDDRYTDFRTSLNTLDAPAMFTPGDNDWTDCDRGPFDANERLAFERKVFFSTPFSLGRHPLRQEVQDEPFVENRRWTAGHVTFATLNVQGSCNNLCDVNPDPAEFARRNAADIAWLHAAFAEARARRSAAVMIVWQANPGFDASDATRAPVRDPKTLAQTDGQPDGFRELLVALRDETTAFRRPVVLVHGDSHYFRIDKPLLDAQGRRLENFTRVETFGDHQENGDNDVHWLKVEVSPGTREVFAYQPQIVPGNRTAVGAP
jgi:hypothetical protein